MVRKVNISKKGIPVRHKKRENSVQAKIEKLWEDGLSDEAIGKIVGLTREQVRDRRYANGIIDDDGKPSDMRVRKKMPEGVCFKCGVNERGHKCSEG